jgi:hypothetical protein
MQVSVLKKIPLKPIEKPKLTEPLNKDKTEPPQKVEKTEPPRKVEKNSVLINTTDKDVFLDKNIFIPAETIIDLSDEYYNATLQKIGQSGFERILDKQGKEIRRNDNNGLREIRYKPKGTP